MNIRIVFALFFILSLLMASSCRQQEQSKTDQETSLKPNPKTDYLALAISLDTLSRAEYRKRINEEEHLLRSASDAHGKAFYHYFKGLKYETEKQLDSARIEYEKMAATQPGDEIDLLKSYKLLDLSTNYGVIVEFPVMNKILALLKKAEQADSRITYHLYDLLAKAYFQNDNDKESLKYAEHYYSSHPYKFHPEIKQRYYDISYLLAYRIKDYEKMMSYNVMARNLALSLHDSLAIARTYDNEAQIYDSKGQFGKALASSRAYVNYLKKTNNLNDIAYSNLATSFIHNQMMDSAIYYFKKAIVLSEKNPKGRKKPTYFNGLIEAYKAKGAYAEALDAAESASRLQIRDLLERDAVKVAEIHEKYNTEKKDRNIDDLRKRNELSEKIILQQRWTMGLALLVFVGLLLFFYILHRQYRLKEKNQLLQSENKRLNIEQKLLQVQLNPHFIFNSIANLQSLVATGDRDEAGRYLTVFSGLLRNILEQNRKDFISLEEEISSLDNYLLLQQMRFPGLFEYQIILDENIYAPDLLIPPMLLQPFVENAIEHGFRNIDYKGLLSISFRIENGVMNIMVDDDGIGLINKDIPSPKKQSLASIILKERLDLLFTSPGQEAKFEIEDKKHKKEHGVTVHIIIPEIKE
ncbi:sensor histidine kinase [Pedobacter sp. KBW06]|uniref:histidine kinase n=1 Tax=Pedobacter sp. KBW06 TaxID=2153359 RepID=UPI000F592F52|nr:histidine kinase [Pedobacter sp. KBW06]RQO74698.1 sensor histidine kinase [Pedobacter sp. KBW06]